LFDFLVVSTLPLVPKFIVGRIAARYVAGETLEEALGVIRSLNEEGAMATVDLLGEEVRQISEAEEATKIYLDLLDAIAEQGLDCNISVKPSQLGLKIDPTMCHANYERLAEKVAAQDNFMRLDMEDRTATDSTLQMYRHLHDRFGHVGVVLQAYMRRTLQDIAELPAEGANVRICKGIYIEPREAAWKGYDTVRANFSAALEKLLSQGVYVGIATHDEYLVCRAVEILDRLAVPRDRYEFQMLLGVEPKLRRILLDGGHRLRVYVPFGRDWYLYSVRRLRENPQIARHVISALLRGE
jgi:proline dehydrogenase